MIIVDEFKQRSPEWHRTRAKIPTASEFKKIITTKGEPSKSRFDYMYQLAGESIAGTSDTYTSWAMQQGIDREDEARRFYEMVTGVNIQQVAFVYRNKNKDVGCSPDGLLHKSGVEIKCPLIKTHVRYLLNNKKLPTEYFQQVHGSMWICDTKHWVFMSYYPGLPPFILEVKRDYKFTDKLEKEIETFNQELEIVYTKLKEKAK